MYNESNLDYETKYDLWEAGEIPDAFGHWIGDGYEFNNPYPINEIDSEDQDNAENEELKVVEEWESNEKAF